MSKTTVLTAEEWATRMAAAAKTAEDLLAFLEAKETGPGQSVLGLVLAARALCHGYPELPPLAWYFQTVSELLRDREPPS
jgi:hypothetical protein